MKAVVDAKPWRYDPLALRQPWSDEEYHLASHGGEGAKLSFAMMWDDNVVKPHPPYARAMEETKQALLAAGHEGWPSYQIQLLLNLILVNVFF